MSDKKTANHC